jgi:protein SCO1/2
MRFQKAFWMVAFGLVAAFPLGAEMVSGQVIEVDGAKRLMRVVLDGAKDAQPFEVVVSEGDAKVGYALRRVKGELFKSDGKWMLDVIWPDEPELWQRMQEGNAVLHADTASRQKKDFRKQGDFGVDFALLDQSASLLEFGSLRGRWVMLNFIFTRCRMLEMCPAQTTRMVEVQALAQAAGKELMQLSVSFDPEYDTPGVFRQYADMKGADSVRHRFLSGPKEVVMDLLKQYGVIAFESQNIVDHTVVTLLFDPDGRIILRRDGTRWEAADFVDAVAVLPPQEGRGEVELID